ncbi:MAG: hypothetical protein QHJ73_09535, partial [Armatimonadota bacterium]|nr:hypothetical protein [Armatimonadota bacterium]
KRAGVDVHTVVGLERGTLSPLQVGAERMARLVHALDVSIWTVLERVQDAEGWRHDPPQDARRATYTAPGRMHFLTFRGVDRDLEEWSPFRAQPADTRIGRFQRNLLEAWRRQR